MLVVCICGNFLSVGNLSATVAGIDCDELEISWFLEGDSIMLHQLNYSVMLMSGGIMQSFNVSGSDCGDMNLQGVSCGEYLTIFYYAITGLQANQSYIVTVATIAESIYTISNSSLTTTANTTIAGLNSNSCVLCVVCVLSMYICFYVPTTLCVMTWSDKKDFSIV